MNQDEVYLSHSPVFTERPRVYVATQMDPNLGRRTFTSFAYLMRVNPANVVEAAFLGAQPSSKVQWVSLGEAAEATFRAGIHLVCSEAQAEAYALGRAGAMLPAKAPFALAALNMLGFQDAVKLTKPDPAGGYGA